RAREALWSSFQASVNNAAPSSSKEIQAPKLIIVEKRYRFAGEDVVEVVEVPEDSAQAKQWPLWNATGTETEESINSSSLATASPEPTTTTTQPNLAGPISSSSASAQSFASSTSAPIPPPSKPPTRKPGPRKPRTSLASIPGASKAKKLSTLDKSAMDWRAHVQAEQESGSSVKDELEANRRGGGYLEKVEFLKRVEERKEENLDALKSKKRRKL
ncbi:bucentaur or craniofacial development-domain-containing protein, partial [Crassisporium funariophilum]